MLLMMAGTAIDHFNADGICACELLLLTDVNDTLRNRERRVGRDAGGWSWSLQSAELKGLQQRSMEVADRR